MSEGLKIVEEELNNMFKEFNRALDDLGVSLDKFHGSILELKAITVARNESKKGN